MIEIKRIPKKLIALFTFLLVVGSSATFAQAEGCKTCDGSIQDGRCDTNSDIYWCLQETDPDLTDCSRIDSWWISIGNQCME